MKDQTKILAEVLSDKTFFDLDEISNIIETYFKIWQSDELNEELNSNDIVRRRNQLLSQKSQVEMQRNIIEKQLISAKAKQREGIHVNQEWVARTNLAFRAKKAQLANIQNDLANLKSYEKSKNIKESNIMERRVKDKIFELIKKDKGEDYAKHLFEKAEKMVSN